MANKNSDYIVNRSAVPITFEQSGRRRGITEDAVSTIEVAAADNDADTLTMHAVQSSDRIFDVGVANDAITGGTAYDCGFFDLPDPEGGDPVAISGKGDILFDGQSMASARAGRANLFGLGTNGLGPEFIGKRVWEMLGLTEDPHKEYLVVLTGATIGTAAGTITLTLTMTEGP